MQVRLGLFTTANQKREERRNIVKYCLAHMCDQNLIFYNVAIKDFFFSSASSERSNIKDNIRIKSLVIQENNIYEDAAEFLSNIIAVKWDEGDQEGRLPHLESLEFTCKLCPDYSRKLGRVKRANEGGLKKIFKIREQFAEHLADTHPSAHQTLGSRLNIAPAKIKALLIEALNPNLYDVWTKMAKLHSQ